VRRLRVRKSVPEGVCGEGGGVNVLRVSGGADSDLRLPTLALLHP
jgi:hypothetical protein